MHRKIAVTTVAMLMTGQAQAATSKLQRIFTPDMLNAQVAYLESIVGPAMHVYPSQGAEIRQYRVDGCNLTANAKGGAVRNYSLDLSPKCGFDIKAVLGPGWPTTSGLTLSKFIAGRPFIVVKPLSGCILSCGNAADPTVDFRWEGSHASNFINVTLSVTIAGMPSINAVQTWEKTMRSAGADDAYILNLRFNCTQRFDAEAIHDFSNLTVGTIAIGYDLDSDAYQNGCKR